MKYMRYLLISTLLHSLSLSTLNAKAPAEIIAQLQEKIERLEQENKACEEKATKCGETLNRVARKLLDCQREKDDLEEIKYEMEHLIEELQAEPFGDSDTSTITISHDPTYADSDASDVPDSQSIHIDKLEHSNLTLEERLKNCEKTEEALRNCEQLSGIVKAGAGAATLDKLRQSDKNRKLSNSKNIVLKSLINEGGFIFLKQVVKETIPQVPVVEWEGHALLDSHEATEIVAESIIKACEHDKNIQEVALLSAQVYARVKILEQLDKHGITKPLDKLDYHTKTFARGLLCKGIDFAISACLQPVLTRIKS